MAPYDLRQVARLLHVKCSSARRIKGFRVDSRQVSRGDLFFALKGQKVDGHNYLQDVASQGAVAAIVDRSYAGPDHGLNLLRVVDVVESLQSLARHRIERHPAKIVAITGSIGKTTTKEFLHTILRQRFCVSASKGNHNSQVGLPLTILNDLGDNEEVLVLEMGMTKPGHISQLLSIAPADIAVITRVALAHAESYDSLEHIARTKAEIFSHPRTRLGILHRDISNYQELQTVGGCRKLSFSTNNDSADFYLTHNAQGIEVTANGQQHLLPLLPFLGQHHEHNLLAAIAVAHTLGVDWEQIAKAIPELTLPERRMQLLDKAGILFINDSYNACEDSVKAALEHLPAPQPDGRRVAILGTMPELGKFSDESHRQVGQYALDRVDAMFCFGDECQPIIDLWTQQKRSAQIFSNKRQMIEALQSFLKPGDVALIKGANSKKMWEILDEIVLPR